MSSHCNGNHSKREREFELKNFNTRGQYSIGPIWTYLTASLCKSLASQSLQTHVTISTTIVQFSSVQFKIVSIHSEKPIIMRSTPSLRSSRASPLKQLDTTIYYKYIIQTQLMDNRLMQLCLQIHTVFYVR